MMIKKHSYLQVSKIEKKWATVQSKFYNWIIKNNISLSGVYQLYGAVWSFVV
jgi:hypothetical protein